MDIAIIGAGNVGRALAGAVTRAGNSVTVTARSQEDAQKVADDIGCVAAPDTTQAVEGAEVVVLAVPTTALDELLGEIGERLTGKVVVDVTNRLDPNDPPANIDGSSNAEMIQSRAPGARVVKAFNTVFASKQANPRVDGQALDGYVAGDDEEAKRTVLGFMEAIGYRPIDAGPLGMARALEAMATLLISVSMRDKWSWQDGFKIVGPSA